MKIKVLLNENTGWTQSAALDYFNDMLGDWVEDGDVVMIPNWQKSITPSLKKELTKALNAADDEIGYSDDNEHDEDGSEEEQNMEREANMLNFIKKNKLGKVTR